MSLASSCEGFLPETDKCSIVDIPIPREMLVCLGRQEGIVQEIMKHLKCLSHYIFYSLLLFPCDWPPPLDELAMVKRQ